MPLANTRGAGRLTHVFATLEQLFEDADEEPPYSLKSPDEHVINVLDVDAWPGEGL